MDKKERSRLLIITGLKKKQRTKNRLKRFKVNKNFIWRNGKPQWQNDMVATGHSVPVADTYQISAPPGDQRSMPINRIQGEPILSTSLSSQTGVERKEERMEEGR